MCNIIIKTFNHDICGATLDLSCLQMFEQVSVIFQWIYSFWGILHLSWEPLYFITISWSRINLSCFLFRATLTAWQPAKLLESFTNSLYPSLSRLCFARVARLATPSELRLCGCDYESLPDAQAAKEDALCDGSTFDGAGWECRTGLVSLRCVRVCAMDECKREREREICIAKSVSKSE